MDARKCTNSVLGPHPNESEARLPTPPTDTPPSPVPTVSFTGPLPGTLRELALTDRRIEEERLAARAKRLQVYANTADGNSTDTVGTPIAGLAPEPKLSKKERDRLAKAGQTDEVLHKAANDAVSMALGGRKGKKYSWLSGGGMGGNPSGDRSRMGTPGRTDISIGGSGSGSSELGSGAMHGSSAEAGVFNAGAGTASKADKRGRRGDRKIGEWREDGPKGKGIHLRDLISALEMDGKEKRALSSCLTKLRNSDF